MEGAMGILSKEFETPAFWDGPRERRIFLRQTGDGWWGIYWMRGYSGLNKMNRFTSIPFDMERPFVERQIREMAKKKGWSEMKRCPKCGLLHHSGEQVCHLCALKGDDNGR
jgi:hypothetical protein